MRWDAAHQRALEHFASHKVMRRYEELFEHLSVLRRAAPAATELPQPPLRFDPVRCFAGYASHKKPFDRLPCNENDLPDDLVKARQPFADQLSRAIPSEKALDWDQLLQRKHS